MKKKPALPPPPCACACHRGREHEGTCCGQCWYLAAHRDLRKPEAPPPPLFAAAKKPRK